MASKHYWGRGYAGRAAYQDNGSQKSLVYSRIWKRSKILLRLVVPRWMYFAISSIDTLCEMNNMSVVNFIKCTHVKRFCFKNYES